MFYLRPNRKHWLTQKKGKLVKEFPLPNGQWVSLLRDSLIADSCRRVMLAENNASPGQVSLASIGKSGEMPVSLVSPLILLQFLSLLSCLGFFP